MEYSEEYIKELEAKLWEMIDLKKQATSGDEMINTVRDNIFNCLDEAEDYLCGGD